jgi:RHS repeat-associated protein
VSGNNGLFYIYSDHLGSSSVLVKSTDPNNIVNGSRTWYLPFGGYRPGSTPTQTITDRDFTGQKENMELGLLYYGARFYVPGLGRFATADTIVPNPANPQSYNRYSYVRNNPLSFTDPTGHCAENGDESCWALAEQLAQQYGLGLDYLGRLSYQQLFNSDLARVLAYTLQQYDLVQQGAITDLEAMMNIMTYSIEDVASGNEFLGLGYAASVFYRPIMENLGVQSGFDYRELVPGTFGVSGFDPIYGSGNQVEHFINEAYATSFILYTTHPPIGDLLAGLIPVGFELRGWFQNGFSNPDFIPDTILGEIAVRYARELYRSPYSTPEERQEIGEGFFQALKVD